MIEIIEHRPSIREHFKMIAATAIDWGLGQLGPHTFGLIEATAWTNMPNAA
jgi:hypothetical protein